MKRKHDEGYALLFALVVLLFLSIVAMFMMQLTGRDLNAQVASVDRMKDQYVAQGKLEQIIGQMDAATSVSQFEDLCTNTQQIPNSDENSYNATIQIVHGGAKYDVTIDCAVKLTKGNAASADQTFRVEYISYSITSTERTGSESGGATE